MKNKTEQSRFLRSADELKSYFEQKMKDAPLTDERADSVRQALEDLTESWRDLSERREALVQLEERPDRLPAEIPSNVVFIHGAARRSRSRGFTGSVEKRRVLRLDCLIESVYVSEIHKMALELHSQSRRYAFVEYRDIDTSQRVSVPDLLSIGTVTLFVPNVLDLSFSEQRALHQLMRAPYWERPLLMVGSIMPFSELRGQPGVNMDFLNELSRAYIKLTKPFAEYKDQGLIHYFLDSLSESPT